MTHKIWACWPHYKRHIIWVLSKSPLWSKLPRDVKGYIMNNSICEWITVCNICEGWLGGVREERVS